MISLSADPVIKLPQKRRGKGREGVRMASQEASVHKGERGLSSEGPQALDTKGPERSWVFLYGMLISSCTAQEDVQVR